MLKYYLRNKDFKMTVGVKVNFFWYPIGTGDFFYSFFSTICVNIEYSRWGSKFPILMQELYTGTVSYNNIYKAIEEINIVDDELKRIPPNKVVWSFEDRTKMPPWGSNISPDINNLSDYFITCDGKNLISVLKIALNKAELEKVDIEVKSL